MEIRLCLKSAVWIDTAVFGANALCHAGLWALLTPQRIQNTWSIPDKPPSWLVAPHMRCAPFPPIQQQNEKGQGSA